MRLRTELPDFVNVLRVHVYPYIDKYYAITACCQIMEHAFSYAEPAHSIIMALGGDIPVARWLKVNQSTVNRWRHPKEARSWDGFIPRPHHDGLIAMAAEMGMLLRLEDFVRKDPVTDVELKTRFVQRAA